MTPTEQDDRPGGPRRPTTAAASFSPLWLGAGLLLLMVLANGIRAVVGQGEELQYSQFKSLVSEGRVSDVVITADRIDGTYQNASNAIVPFYTVRIEDPKLLELLESKNVPYKAKADSRWVTELLSWVLPVAAHRRRLAVLLPAHERRRRRHHVVRPQPRQDLLGRRRQGELRGCRGRGRGRRRNCARSSTS